MILLSDSVQNKDSYLNQANHDSTILDNKYH